MCWARLTRDIRVIARGEEVYVQTRPLSHYIGPHCSTLQCAFIIYTYILLSVFFNMDLSLVKKRDWVNLFTYSIMTYLRLIYL